MEFVCSFIEGGGLREADEGCADSFTGSDSFLAGCGALEAGSWTRGLHSDGTSAGSPPGYTLARSILGGSPSFPSKYSAPDTAGLLPKVG